MTGAARKFVMAAVMLSVAQLVVPGTTAAATPASVARAVVVDDPDDMTKGSPTAPITLIVYASVTCRHCADFNETILPQIEAKYIETGKVKYVYREFLTPPNDVSAAGVMLARCAGKDRYFDVIDSVMQSQQEMFSDGTTANARPVLVNIAEQAGLSVEQFAECITNEKAIKRLNVITKKYLTEHGIVEMPTFYINGVRFERQTGDFAEFERAFAALGAE